ncbi:MAG: NAD(P)-dependent oxidoreductase [Desulfuromonadales bacterium]|nr:NAD(P)-dependent oxidoreductase [Desulfuromonadales bacterium]
MLDFDELEKSFSEQEAQAEAARCLNCGNPKCVPGCPIENRIPEFIQAIKAGNYAEAIKLINARSNLAVICARVCPHSDQCEGACVLAKKGEGVRISKLERFLADKEMELSLRVKEKVAVIGSGPAGLTVAALLAHQGYRISVFEARPLPGGVLRYGIPEYRLPKTMVDKQIEIIRALGVRFETGVVIGEDITLDQLFAMGYKAVFIATGTGLARKLEAEGEELTGVLQAVYFLETVQLVREGELPPAHLPVRRGDRVVVVGAGNVAVDAARTALRFGAGEVLCVDIVEEQQRRVSDREYQEAREEGVNFRFQTGVVRIHGEERVTGVSLQAFHPRQPAGRDSVILPVADSHRLHPCDKVIIAIGQKPFARIVATTTGLKTNERGYVLTSEAPFYGMTSRPGVFAAGDVVHEPQTVILAMREGRKVAEAIDTYLKSLHL